MPIEQITKAVMEQESKREVQRSEPIFEDSNRTRGMELPGGNEIDSIDIPEGEFYPDSDRDMAEGPQWDEKEVPDIEMCNFEDCSIEDDESHEGAEEDSDVGDASDENEADVDNPDENDSPEYNEDGTRELTEDERQEYKEKLGWSDEKLKKKCTIDENGVIHYKTDRCDLEGKISENGVPYERRTIEINGVKIEGVFPKFDSAFDTELSPDNYKSKAYAKECNAKLKEAVENDPELRSKFTPEQLEDIKEGRTPSGYVWHHNEEPGKMQLVKREDHDRAIGGAAHTGGSSLWGPDSVDNSKKGESF